MLARLGDHSRHMLAALAFTLVGCGLVSVGGRPIGDAPQPSAPEETGPERLSEWRSVAGDWGTTYGQMTITETEKDFVGAYPSGTLTCTFVARFRNEYKCTYKDDEGSGPAVVWYEGKGLRGEWTDARGVKAWWEFCPGISECKKVIVPSGGSGGGASDLVIDLANRCSRTVDYCLEQPSSTSQTSLGGNATQRVNVRVGAKFRARSGSQCGAVIDVVEASTASITLCE